jgi:hypothetical protein
MRTNGHPPRASFLAEAEASHLPTIIGEVIEANTTRFVARCPRERLHLPPAFGAFARILPPGATPLLADTEPPELPEDPFADPIPLAPGVLPPAVPDGTLYALVCSAATGSSEPGRRPTAYGLDEAQLRAEQPQIFDLLATEFAALPIGYVRNGRFQRGLPPRPPRLHAFVWDCSPAEIQALTETPDFLRPLLAVRGEVATDELIAACLRGVYETRNRDFDFLVRAGKELALLLRDEPERLTALLQRLEP